MTEEYSKNEASETKRDGEVPFAPFARRGMQSSSSSNSTRSGGSSAPSSSSNNAAPSAGANAGGTGGSNNAPGGLLGFFINRKKTAGGVTGVDQHASSAATSSSPSTASDNSATTTTTAATTNPRSTMMKYHEMVNAGGSFYFGSIGALIDDTTTTMDSSDDEAISNNSPRKIGISPPSTVAVNDASNTNSSSSSWLASFRQKASLSSSPNETLEAESSSPSSSLPSSSSWMSQAWQTVDSAKEWMLTTSTSSDDRGDRIIDDGDDNQSNSSTVSSWSTSVLPSLSLSTTMSNTLTSITSNLNPFFSDSDSSQALDANSGDTSTELSNQNNNPSSSSSALLPKIASRFEWATKQRNPYQAVIGRGDADYLLSNHGASLSYTWNLFSWWLPWITNNHPAIPPLLENSNNGSESNGNTNKNGGTFSENGNKKEMIQQFSFFSTMGSSRKKSQPSEASVQAVRNLLALVQQQVAMQQLQQNQQHQLDNISPKLSDQETCDHQPHSPPPSLPNATQSQSVSPKPDGSDMSAACSPALPSLLSPNSSQGSSTSTTTIPQVSRSTMTPFPNLKEEATTTIATSSQSFESEASYDATTRDIRASPARGGIPSPTSTTVTPSATSAAAAAAAAAAAELVQTPIANKSSGKGPFSPVSSRKWRGTVIGRSSSSDMDNDQNNSNNQQQIDSDNVTQSQEPSPPSVANNNTTEANQQQHQHQAMQAEMAARLAEGTLRAYRDLALDEATELHSALHHWTIRWERPFLGWLEAGPEIWFSERGYTPQLAGKKVSQIQAVLARRCAVIGELQQHLWRANWQKGVAEWGMLGGGVGGEWTSVVGEFGGMETVSSGSSGVPSSNTQQQHQQQQQQQQQQPKKLMKIFNHSSFVGTNVKNSPGGSIVVDQNGLTTWSIDAMRVIRDQLYRALPHTTTGEGGGSVKELPFVEHWPRERRHFRGCCDSDDNDDGTAAVASSDLPSWAREEGSLNGSTKLSDAASCVAAEVVNTPGNQSSVIIADLNKMSNEVGALLQSIEIHLEQQRVRRLRRLRPPSRLRRNWYMVAVGVPVGAYVLYKLTKEHGGFFLLKTCFVKLADIYRDHVSEPLNSIYQELFTKTGRMDVTDRKARIDAIESLKRMIRSWLEESFPDMPLEEKITRAETMDISLIEEKMEESIKHIYELNSVVRMSLIEMQFMRKELLSALVAMDELMGSNEINMQLAAMTPAVILLLTIRRGFRLLFYAFFQVGKSKDEIYSSFRQTILDIERLLVMRDNPPLPPEALEWGSSRPTTNKAPAESLNAETVPSSQTLSAEDLGMLLLHIHECRSILWESRRRFGSDVLRNVSEDLAELAGERGPVSVSQQLQIISRMSRTYPFMKVVSSGIPFEMIIPGT